MVNKTSFCLQYSTSVQQSSLFTTSEGQLGLGIMAEIEEVTTTRFTPTSFAAVSTFNVPLIAGSKSSFYKIKPNRFKTSAALTHAMTFSIVL